MREYKGELNDSPARLLVYFWRPAVVSHDILRVRFLISESLRDLPLLNCPRFQINNFQQRLSLYEAQLCHQYLFQIANCWVLQSCQRQNPLVGRFLFCVSRLWLDKCCKILWRMLRESVTPSRP